MTEHGEVADGWRTSSKSDGPACVEVDIRADEVRVRHSRDRLGPVLTFTHAEWQAFLAGVHGGEFELPTVSTS